MSRGYMGKLLFVNLSTGKIETEALDEALCKDFIGGYGIGARILYSRQKAGASPLGPENTLGLLTGPLAGVSTDMEAQALWNLGALEWDRVTTRPSRMKLLEIGLKDVVDELWPPDKMPGFGGPPR